MNPIDEEFEGFAQDLINNETIIDESLKDYLIKKRIDETKWSLILAMVVEKGFERNQVDLYSIFHYMINELVKDISNFIFLLETITKYIKRLDDFTALFSSIDTNLEILLALYERLIHSNNTLLYDSSYFILSQIGFKDQSILFDKLNDILKSKEIQNILLGLNTLIVISRIFKVRPNLIPSSTIIEFVIQTIESDREEISRKGMVVAVSLFGHSSRFQHLIREYIRRSDKNKISFLTTIQRENLGNSDIELSLILECCNTKSIDVIIGILSVFYQKLRRNTLDKKRIQIESLKLYKKHYGEEKFNQRDHSSFLNAVGQVDSDYVRIFLEEWIEELDKGAVSHDFVSSIYDLFKESLPQIIPVLKSWIKRNDLFFLMVILISEKVANDIKHTSGLFLARFSSHMKRLSKSEIPDFDSISASNIDEVNRKVSRIIQTIPDLPVDEKEKRELLKFFTKAKREVEDKFLVLNELTNLLKMVAIEKGFDAKKITGNYNNNDFQSLIQKIFILTHHILKKPPEKLNCEQILSGLNSFYNISKFIDRKKLSDKCKRNIHHPILERLNVISKEESIIKLLKSTELSKQTPIATLLNIRSYQYSITYLHHIDTCLTVFANEDDKGTSIIKNNLVNEDQFYQTVSQLEIAYRLKKKFPTIVIEHKIDNQPIDIIVEENSKKIYFEITSLDMQAELKYGRFKGNMNNKLKDIVKGKLKQIEKYGNKVVGPIIVIIDTSRAPEIDEDDEESLIFGSPAIRIITDNRTNKIIDQKITRDNDSIWNELSSYNLSGIIIYKRYFEMNSIGFKGNIHSNPNARFILEEQDINNITQTIFN